MTELEMGKVDHAEISSDPWGDPEEYNRNIPASRLAGVTFTSIWNFKFLRGVRSIWPMMRISLPVADLNIGEIVCPHIHMSKKSSLYESVSG